MRKARIGLILLSLFAVLLGAAGTTPVGAAPLGGGALLPHQTMVQPVVTWRDCQRIARCTGCRPVYHCRACSYQRKCKWGICEWADTCVWGPYLPVAPRGVRVY